MAPRVVVSDNKVVDLGAGRDVLEDAGAEIVTAHMPTEEAVIEGAEGADALIVDAGTPVTARVFDELASLEVVGRAGIGFDNVDVPAAEEHGVVVTHVPDYCVDEVSTHAFGLLLSCVRNLFGFDRRTGGGEWNWEHGRPIERLRGRTLGLVAFGKIARRLARKVDGFGLNVRAYDPFVPVHEMEHYGVEKVDFETLLSTSDLVSIHAPLYERTRHMFDAEAFDLMGEDTVLVNTGRGGIVDEEALAAAIDDGTVARAGLDVMEEEPPSDSPLVGADEVVITPHTAWYSEDSRRDLSRSVAEDVTRVLTGSTPRNRVTSDTRWA
jgi:D-3-phosphoglycerate dehydrogenase